MYCRNCGKEIDDDAVICVHCGCEVQDLNKLKANAEYYTKKTGMGILLGIFAGIFGLLIGMLVYPEGTVARKSFVKSWLITFIICFVLEIVATCLILWGYGFI